MTNLCMYLTSAWSAPTTKTWMLNPLVGSVDLAYGLLYLVDDLGEELRGEVERLVMNSVPEGEDLDPMIRAGKFDVRAVPL